VAEQQFTDSNPLECHLYPMAPLIRGTLLSLYLALVLPLPALAPADLRLVMGLLVAAGLLLLVAITSERVTIDGVGIRVGHPPWCAWLLRRGWSLAWPEISGLTAVATSQGGRVYYVRGPAGLTLLPQRVAGFDHFLARFQALSGMDTGHVARISPPWTYRLLAVLSGLLVLGEVLGLGLLNRHGPG
jgi:hypothetical protein